MFNYNWPYSDIYSDMVNLYIHAVSYLRMVQIYILTNSGPPSLALLDPFVASSTGGISFFWNDPYKMTGAQFLDFFVYMLDTRYILKTIVIYNKDLAAAN